jgi:hypothetical protein
MPPYSAYSLRAATEKLDGDDTCYDCPGRLQLSQDVDGTVSDVRSLHYCVHLGYVCQIPKQAS